MRQIYSIFFFVSYIFAIPVLNSCSKSTNITTLDIPVKYTDAKLESSSVLKNQTYVKLQSTEPRAMIGNINRLMCADSLLFIVDRNNNKIVSFDYAGNFINTTLDIIGHASNEYIHLTDAAIDEDNRLIYLYSDIPYQILILDYNLEVKESIPMKELLLEIAVDSKYLYALCPDLSDGSRYDLRCYRKDDLTTDPIILLRQDQAIPNIRGMGKLLDRSGKSIFTSMPFEEKIYKISDGEVIQQWNLDLGDRWFDYCNSKDLRGREFFSANADKNWTIQNIASSSSEIIFNTNKTTVFKIFIETEECEGYAGFDNASIPFSDSWFISTSGIYDVSFSIPASLIVEYNNYFTTINESLPDNPLNSIILSTTMEDNPVIVLAKLK